MKLHIGGKIPHPDWQILDAEPRPEVDFVGSAGDLSFLPSESVAELYASHVLEHFHDAMGAELFHVLAEWKRVLQPGGRLYVAVPDLDVWCRLYIQPHRTVDEKHFLMSILFGGQKSLLDVHRSGFSWATLAAYLEDVGYRNIQRVADFGLFHDTSLLTVFGEPASLNVIAEKPQRWVPPQPMPRSPVNVVESNRPYLL
ncbi:MAG: class I SAM-dependent methyltransferase [Pseudanabaenaceae cyanobacterium]